MPVPDIVYPAAAVAPFGPTLFKPGATCIEWMTRDSVRFLQTATGAMFDLRDSLVPEDAAKDESYPIRNLAIS